MPAPLFNENLDDPLALEACTDFRGGANRSVAPHLLLPNEYAWATNCVMDVSGALQTRGGTSNVTAAPSCDRALLTALPGNEAKLLFVGDNIVRNTPLASPAGTAASVGSPALGTSRSLALGANKAYIQTSTDLWEYDGSAVYQVRRVVATLGVAGSGYDVNNPPTVTVTPHASELGGRPTEAAVVSVTVLPGGSIGQVNVVSPGRGYTLPPTITVAAPTSGTTATIQSSLRTPPTGKFAVWHTNRLFTSNKSALNVSDFFDASYFAVANSTSIGGGDGQEITGLASWDNFNLLVFKGQSVYLVVTDPLQAPADWQVQRLSTPVGSVAHRTAVTVGTDVWWLSQVGVVSVRRLLQETQREVNTAISLPIADKVRAVNWLAAQSACAAYHDNKVFFALPLGSATTPSHLFVYDTLAQRWMGEWAFKNEVTVRDFVTPYLGNPDLMLLLSDGRLVRYVEALDTDSTASSVQAIETTQELRAFSFGEPTLPKSLLGLTLEFAESEADAVDVSFRVDEGAFVPAVTLGTTARQVLRLPFTLPATLVSPGNLTSARTMMGTQFYYLQVRLKSLAGFLRLRALKLSAFGDNIVLTR